mmetsp:Transcript_32823/g.79792  ORF Transcript_32823/g.79792 Transcript_32823/m.79792 type:complete len:105 (-) Transcript_32823:134-448(-)
MLCRKKQLCMQCLLTYGLQQQQAFSFCCYSPLSLLTDQEALSAFSYHNTQHKHQLPESIPKDSRNCLMLHRQGTFLVLGFEFDGDAGVVVVKEKEKSAKQAIYI